MAYTTVSGRTTPDEFHRIQMILMRMRKQNPSDLPQIDAEFPSLPENVRTEIHHCIIINQIGCSSTNILTAILFRLRTSWTFTPERRKTFCRRSSQETESHCLLLSAYTITIRIYGKMRMHFSRVKDCVLVAVQRRNAGRAAHGSFYKKDARSKNRFAKRFFSSRALLFP